MFLSRFGLHVMRSGICSLHEIRRMYPGEWVAVAVSETDPDGLMRAGKVLVHSDEESLVWRTAHLGDSDDLKYVFFTGNQTSQTIAA
jgi:hypothetical protein